MRKYHHMSMNHDFPVPAAIEVSPHPNGWQVYEDEECCPVFTVKADAVSYAKWRPSGMRAGVHVLTEDCSIEEFIPAFVANR